MPDRAREGENDLALHRELGPARVVGAAVRELTLLWLGRARPRLRAPAARRSVRRLRVEGGPRAILLAELPSFCKTQLLFTYFPLERISPILSVRHGGGAVWARRNGQG